jgi:hypothetical protein
MITRVKSIQYNTAREMGVWDGGVVYKYDKGFYARTIHYCIKGETQEEAQNFSRQHSEVNSIGEMKTALIMFNRKLILDDL